MLVSRYHDGVSGPAFAALGEPSGLEDAAVIFGLITILILSFYFLVEAESLFNYVTKFLPAANRAQFKTADVTDNSGIFVRFPNPGTDPQVAIDQGTQIAKQ